MSYQTFEPIRGTFSTHAISLMNTLFQELCFLGLTNTVPIKIRGLRKIQPSNKKAFFLDQWC